MGQLCPECRTEFSEVATACPHCGHVAKPGESEHREHEVGGVPRSLWIGLIVCLPLLLVGGLGFVVYMIFAALWIILSPLLAQPVRHAAHEHDEHVHHP